jgi:hypothetical protein
VHVDAHAYVRSRVWVFFALLHPADPQKETLLFWPLRYGRVSPEKVYRQDREAAPVWVPNNGISQEFPAVEAPPANKYRAKVRTQYDHAVNVY